MKPLPPEAFAPVAREDRLERPFAEARTRSLLDVMAGNRRARLAAATALLLVLFALFGPVLWPQDSAQQWLSQISRGPMGATSARVVVDPGRWQPDGEPAAFTALEANTQWVRLAWPATPGATLYQLYRSADLDGEGLGIPLGESLHPWFEDRLNLRPQRYRYTVVSYRGADATGERRQTIVKPEPAVTWFEAQLQGLVPVDGEAAQWRGRDVVQPAHPLGTDSLGRDMLARLIHGARTSLFVGVMAPLLFIAVGTLYGALAGLLGGAVDNWLMRGADFVIALPFLLFMILLRVMFGIGPGESGIFPMIVAMVLLGWPAARH